MTGESASYAYGRSGNSMDSAVTKDVPMNAMMDSKNILNVWIW